MAVDHLVAEAEQAGLHHVLVTGGEPLFQEATPELLRRLCDAQLRVALETSGAQSTAAVDPRVTVVLDIKSPSSGMKDRMDWSNLDRLRPHDEVKFVLANRGDYEYARQLCDSYRLPTRAGVLLSPVAEKLAPRELASWILADKLSARLQVQLHRLAWPELG
jgi:7-carboxy-7-deazaguanine synthase